MFLGFCYGIVADLDINSEWMRGIGESRYHIYGAYRIVNVVNYPATFTFNGCLLKSRYDKKTTDDFINDQTITAGFKDFRIMNGTHQGQNIYVAPMVKPNDGMSDAMVVTADKSKRQLGNMMLISDSADKYFLKSKNKERDGLMDPGIGMDYYKLTSWELKPERKGPVPEGCEYQVPEGTVINRRDVFSIDGESYPA